MGARAGLRSDPHPGADRWRGARHGPGRHLDQRTDVELRAQAHRCRDLPRLVRHRDHDPAGRFHGRHLRPNPRGHALIETGFAGLEEHLWLWMVAMIRPGAAFVAAPVFGAAFVPVQLRLVVALAIGIAAINAVHFTLPPGGLASIAGFLMIGRAMMTGLAPRLSVPIGFSA